MKNGQNDHFHEGGKVGRKMPLPSKPFFVDSYDLKSMSFKFGNDIFIIFEMPRSSFLMSVGKICSKTLVVDLIVYFFAN